MKWLGLAMEFTLTTNKENNIEPFKIEPFKIEIKEIFEDLTHEMQMFFIKSLLPSNEQ